MSQTAHCAACPSHFGRYREPHTGALAHVQGKHFGVDFRGFGFFMLEQALQKGLGHAVHQQVHSKAVSERLASPGT